MKKVILSSLAAALLVPTIAPTYASAKEFQTSPSTSTTMENQQNDMISTIEPYVHVTEQGTLELRDVPQYLYDEYSLEYLEDHFATLNQLAAGNSVVIHDDLSITNTAITPFAVYGQWTYNWWGYDRYYTNYQANQFSAALSSAAALGYAGAAGASVLGLPAVGALSGLSAAYWDLLAARIDANNHGRGVYVGITWAAVFNVEPL